MTVCPSRTELVAVGANDPYVRVYDRRMISCGPLDTSCDPCEDNTGAVAYFVPGHLPGAEVKFHRRLRPLASTYIAYNSAGTELLCNLGGEQVYLYDRWALYSQAGAQFTKAVMENCDKIPSNNGYTNGKLSSCGLIRIYFLLDSSLGQYGHSGSGTNVRPLTGQVEKVKMAANVEFESENYDAAVSLYNRALVLHRAPHPVLCGNRAAALMKRAWDGDIYAAARDCLQALALDPAHVKAHLRLAQCLLELEWLAEASQCLDNFKIRHPEFIKSKAFIQLARDFEVAKEKIKPGKCRTKMSSLPAASSPVLQQYCAADFLRSSSDDDGDEEDAEADDDMDTDDADEEDPRGFGSYSPELSRQEARWRRGARDYSTRYLGTCNTTTDIKEANFLGSDGQYIMAGSDDGKFFIWNRRTSNIEQVLVGDDNIVNCLQSHPHAPILATSGIDPVVRIWQPLPENGDTNQRQVRDLEAAATSNQRRMNADPFETILMGMGYR